MEIVTIEKGDRVAFAIEKMPVESPIAVIDGSAFVLFHGGRKFHIEREPLDNGGHMAMDMDSGDIVIVRGDFQWR